MKTKGTDWKYPKIAVASRLLFCALAIWRAHALGSGSWYGIGWAVFAFICAKEGADAAFTVWVKWSVAREFAAREKFHARVAKEKASEKGPIR